MNIPIWILVAGVVCLPLFGFLICAVLTAGKVADLRDKLFHTECEYEAETGLTEVLVPKLREANAAHTRCADALTTTQRKLSAIRELVGPPEGIRRGRLGQIAAILDGERV